MNLIADAPKVHRSRHHFFDAGATPESSEWYTPAKYLDAARTVMGRIDLDVASCATAQRTVQAARYFDKAMDGLRQPWHGNVWCNPPYSGYSALPKHWAAKMLAEYNAGRMVQGILLVNFGTMTQTAMQAIAQVGLTCIVNHRIRFENAEGSTGKSPTQGNVFLYLGANRRSFAEYFGRFGVVLEKPPTPASDVSG